MLGAKVALVEREFTGGDCLVTGCVPSKSLLRAARAAAEVRESARFGIHVERVTVDFAAAMDRMRSVRAAISRHDAAAAFRDEYGVDVFFADARFAGPDGIDIDGTRVRFRRALIATGSRPAVPNTPGLAEAGFETNQTIFNLTERPNRLAIIGGGPLGCEMAQAFARLGSKVTVVQQGERLLPREDPDASSLLLRVFEHEGIRVILNAQVESVSSGGGKSLRIDADGRKEVIQADVVLVAIGREPTVEGLNLEAARVSFGREGVKVDDYLRTTNRRIFAAGDVCLKERFTHTADASARLAVQNALLLPLKKWSRQVIPRVTYTDPEVAFVGRSGEEGSVREYSVPLAQIDRAITDGESNGIVKIRVRRGSDRIVSATVVASHAGEIIGQLTMAISHGIGLGDLSQLIFPYPTQSEAIRSLSDHHVREGLKGWKTWALRKWTRSGK
jgi:pyruvate/2-oxoglutarate dehydrogenase complex dihydrolipoamide dehydrogenase (E3) component